MLRSSRYVVVVVIVLLDYEFLFSPCSLFISKHQLQKKRTSQMDVEGKPTKELYYRKVGKRKVLNGRRLSFQSTQQESNPLYLSSTLLTLALSLRENSAPGKCAFLFFSFLYFFISLLFFYFPKIITSLSTLAHFASFEDMTNFLKPVDLTILSCSEKTG